MISPSLGSCSAGYTKSGSVDGKTCVADNCASTACANGGTCTNAGTSSVTCACVTGYAGPTCASCDTGYTMLGSLDGKTCILGHCDSTSCVNGGTCTNTASSFVCTCAVGYDLQNNCGACVFSFLFLHIV
jgi:hypothetical protein